MKRFAPIFLTLTLLFLLIAGGALCFIPKGELHLLLCCHHKPILDVFFRYYTVVGEWVPYVVAIGLLFYSRAWGVFTIVVTILSGLSTQLLKHIVDAPRPLTWFAANMPDVTLPLVDGVKMSQYYSFPSGHTTSFFALFLALSLLVSHTALSRKAQYFLQTLFFLLALLGGYSRIYLSQHFLSDVLGGAFVGVCITLVVYGLWKKTPLANL